MTTEALVVDGANAVCRFPRTGAHRDALPGVAWHLAIALTLLLVLVARRPRARRWLLTVLLLAVLGSAIPGMYALLAVRADAPLRQAETGRQIGEFLAAVDDFVTRHDGCVVLDSQCFGCRGVLLYVSGARVWERGPVGSEPGIPFPAGHACPGDPALITLGADSLAGGCRTSNGSLACGGRGDGTLPRGAPDDSR